MEVIADICEYLRSCFEVTGRCLLSSDHAHYSLPSIYLCRLYLYPDLSSRTLQCVSFIANSLALQSVFWI